MLAKVQFNFCVRHASTEEMKFLLLGRQNTESLSLILFLNFQDLWIQSLEIASVAKFFGINYFKGRTKFLFKVMVFFATSHGLQ